LLALTGSWHDRVVLRHAAFAYILVAMPFWGVQPGTAMHLPWTGAGMSLLIALAVYAVLYRSLTLAVAAACTASLGMLCAPAALAFASGHGISPFALMSLVAGASLTLVYAASAAGHFPRWAATTAVLLLALGVLHCFFPANSGLHAPALSTILLALWLLALGWRTGGWLVLLPGLWPVLTLAWRLFCDIHGWSFVALSFALLVAGAVVSWVKGGAAAPQEGNP
jgi:hypothetical protein